jgi:hypothetical protein
MSSIRNAQARAALRLSAAHTHPTRARPRVRVATLRRLKFEFYIAFLGAVFHCG